MSCPAVTSIGLLAMLNRIQHPRLNQWNREGNGSSGSSGESVERLPRELMRVVKEKSLKVVAAEAGCGPDTIRDFINGTTKPQQKTIKKLTDCVKQKPTRTQ
jgi:hypothetical protein